VAVEYGVGWHTVMQAVRDHGRPLVADPARLSGVTALGVDETAFLAATSRHHTEFVTGIVDLTGHVSGRPERATRLLDVVEGRSGKALCDWVSARDQDWRDRVEVAALDPFRGYATALRAQLPGAVRVLDAFHVTRLGLTALDEVRRRVQQDTLHRRGHRDDPLYRIRRLLRRAPETLSERAWTRLETGLVLGDPAGEVTQAWMPRTSCATSTAAATTYPTPAADCTTSCPAACSPTSPNCSGSPAPSTPGPRSYSPTSPPTASRTDRLDVAASAFAMSLSADVFPAATMIAAISRCSPPA
jgi:transposase